MAITEPHTPVDEASKKAGYELSDAPASPVVISIAALIALMVAGFIGGQLFKTIFEATEVKTRTAVNPLNEREKVEGPLLQANPEVEWKAYRSRQKDLLESYDWVDRENGRVRIPIERAIELVAQDGFPTWPVINAKVPPPAKLEPPAPPPQPSSPAAYGPPPVEQAAVPVEAPPSVEQVSESVIPPTPVEEASTGTP